MISLNENAPAPVTMAGLEKITTDYAANRRELNQAVTQLYDQIEELKNAQRPLLRKLTLRVSEKHKKLAVAIAAAPHLFQKPRTLTFHGVKCGFRKNEGRLEFDDPDLVVKKIYQIFDAPESFLRIVTQPNKEALATLPGTDLKRLGCRIVDTTDVVVIKPADSDLEKKINALLKGTLLCES